MKLSRLVWGLAPVAVLVAVLTLPGQAREGKKDKNGPGITGKAVPALAGYDRMMTKYLADNGLPGAAIAVTKDGRLMYARGFGYANRDKKEPVRPTSLFRLASVSKPITGVAIMRLVQEGRLKLSDRVFALLKIEPLLEKGARVDPRLKKVTVGQCLHHTGGWDRSVRKTGFDPMFRDVAIARALGKTLPISTHDIIRYMWGKSLDFDPGQRMAYSNFGYCVLGRVIEKVTGQPYEKYVKEHILAPLGARHLRVGRSVLRLRAPNEVHYYFLGKERTGPAVVGPIGKQVPLPYGVSNLENMDAHGGWTASAVDLVRFGAAWDHPEKSGVLSKASVERMFAPAPGPTGHKKDGQIKDRYYGCGWQVVRVGKGRNSYHNGLLAGTSTLLVRRVDGLCWAVLFNSSVEWNKAEPAGPIDGLMHEVADAVKEWPRHDLFGAYPS